MRFLLSIVVLFSVAGLAPLSGAQPAQQIQSAPRGAAAQAVLDYISGLTNRADNRIISGQFGFYGDAETPALADEALLKIYQQSGKHVAMTGIDYNSDYVREKGLDAANAWVISRWNEGYLITISWHAPHPWTDAAGAGEENEFRSVRQLITPGNIYHTRYQASLKHVADGLVKLRDAGVVVIWRPFHEMNGAWFWWHQQTQADFRDLWINMFDYFTNTRGLNNLLWGYSPNIAWDKWAQRPDFYYPGAEYVDVVGLDVYGPRNMDAMELNTAYTNPATGKASPGSYDQLAALGKPLGLFEFGPSPANGSGWQDAPYDYAKLARDIKAAYPKIVFFQAWEWIWQIGRHANAAGLMAHPWVISKDELPSFSGDANPPPTATATAPPISTPTATKTRPPTRTKTPTAQPTTPAPDDYTWVIRIDISIVRVPKEQ